MLSQVSLCPHCFLLSAEALLVEQSTGKLLMLGLAVSSPQDGDLAGCRCLFSSGNSLTSVYKGKRLRIKRSGCGECRSQRAAINQAGSESHLKNLQIAVL